MHSAGTRASILSSYSIGAVLLLAIAIACGPSLLTPDPRDVSVRVNSLAFLYVCRAVGSGRLCGTGRGGGIGMAWVGVRSDKEGEGCVRCLDRGRGFSVGL